MLHRFVLVLVLAGVAPAGAAAAGTAPGAGPAVTLQLGTLVTTSDGDWNGGDLSGAAAVDFRAPGRVSPVVVLGTSRGMRASFPHEEEELSCGYLVAAVRLTATSEGGIPVYLLAGYGMLRATVRDEFGYWPSGERAVYWRSNNGGTALLAAGFIVPVRGSRLAIVGEVSALLPQTGVPGGGASRVPRQALASVGVRVAVGR